MTTDIQLSEFDYAALDAETRIVIKQKTDELNKLLRDAAQNIFDIGGKLAEVRDRLRHNREDSFERWLAAEFGMSRRTAYNFINVYERFVNRANFAQLDIAASALYLLAAPSVPDEAREEALQRAERGEAITHKAAKQLVEAAAPIPDWVAVHDLETRILALLAAHEGGLRYDELRDQLAIKTPQDKANLQTVLDRLFGGWRIVKNGAVYILSEPPTETSQNAAKLLRLLEEMGETTFKPLRDRAGLENSRFWRAFNLLEADGKIVRHPSKAGQFPTVSLASAPAGEPAPGETAQDTQEPEPVSPAPAQETGAKDERALITDAVLEVFAGAQGSLAYGDVLRAVNELLGREVDAKLFGEVITSLHGLLRRDATMRLWCIKAGGPSAPETPNASPDPAPDRAVVLQRDREQADALEARNAGAWLTIKDRCDIEAALLDLAASAAVIERIRSILAWVEVFSPDDLQRTRNLAADAINATLTTSQRLHDLVCRLDVMIETGKPYED